MKWIKTRDELPISGVEVLCWDKKRGFTIGHWVDREDLEEGTYWSINGQSGGIGSAYEIFPPTHWMQFPNPPKE